MKHGKNEGSLEYIKRFSLCNCLTIYFPETYTAHAMTMDFFIKKIQAGTRIPTIHTDLWPSGYVHIFKIPKKIHTFLFSTFNEAYHPNYIFEDGVRYTMGPHTGLAKLKSIAKEIPRLSPKEYAIALKEMDKRISSLWGNVLKLLVFYDHSRAPNDIKARMIEYNTVSKNTLGWPHVNVEEPNSPKPMWYHYSDIGHKSVVEKIIKWETKWDKRTRAAT